MDGELMPTYDFSVTKTVIGELSIDAENEDKARQLIRDKARRIILVDGQSPWGIQIVKENLIDVIGENNEQL
jgi:hypothetical protein